jgi:hypothetical protein
MLRVVMLNAVMLSVVAPVLEGYKAFTKSTARAYSITTFSITIQNETISINTLDADCCYAEHRLR